MRVPDGSVGPSPHEGRDKTRLWVFRIATAVLIPAFLLSILEGALRVSGFGYESALTDSVYSAGPQRFLR